MKFIVDITHPADINYFKHLLYRLKHDGHEIFLVCLNRGEILKIAKHEFPGFQIKSIGTYAKSRIGLLFKAGLLREIKLARFILRFKPDAAIGLSAFQIGILSRLFNFKSLGSYDDPESKLYFNLTRLSVHRFLIPECLGLSGANIVHYRGLKEWAYLSPVYFKPDKQVLKSYGLKCREYIFIRDVDTVSLNYCSQVLNIIDLLYNQGLSNVKVILSLENKKHVDNYSNWLILKEPVKDIHSLMYFSKLVLSNGDSMAREGAVLGVPTIYCGNRTMKANQMLIDKGLLHHIIDPKIILKYIQSNTLKINSEKQTERRKRFLTEWDDPNEMLYRSLMELVAG